MLFNIMKFNCMILLIILVNSVKINADGEAIKCYVCKSSENAKCTQKLDGDNFLEDCKNNEEDCLIKIDDAGKTVRSCGKCEKEEKSSCITYKPTENKVVFPEDRPTCPQCTNCEKVVEENKKLCEVYKKDTLECYIGIDNTAKILRGCKSEQSDECGKGKMTCQDCKKEECEKEFLKTKCVICGDEKDCKRPAEFEEGKCEVKGKSTPDCLPNAENNTCYTYVGSDNTVKRGCAGDAPTEKDKGELTFCSGDDCNSACIHDINCAQCSEEKDADCKQYKEDWYKKKCDPYTSVCYSCPNAAGKLERGCGKTALTKCEYSYKDVSSFTCYRCRSDMPNQQFCADDEITDKKLKPRPCTKSPTKEEEQKCYIDNYGGIIIRGCITDIVQTEVRKRCTVDGKGKFCTVCDKQNCNNGKVPTSSSYAIVSSGILIVGSLISFIL